MILLCILGLSTIIINCSNPNRNPVMQITAFIVSVPCSAVVGNGLGNECYEITYKFIEVENNERESE